ncbi:MAG: CHC2 zinc finger domain-containing protein [Planctomycetia bacterium]|nr:CHC2 zinc finger domain-containing protein [Planctomycetia bacterium]
MSGSSSNDQREQIRDAIDIVDLVSRYVSLHRQGRNYVGRCPWHDDSRPSLQVNQERQTYKCWVCNIGGDIFSFIMQMEGVNFKEAIELLADMAGISLSSSKQQFKKKFFPKKEFQEERSENKSAVNQSTHSNAFKAVEISKSLLYRSMDWLAQKYHEIFLNSSEAEAARNYIRERGINDAMIRQFKIGYSPQDVSWLLNLIQEDRNRALILEAAGVLVNRSHSEKSRQDYFRAALTEKLSNYECQQYYDRFHGRVIFPIRDTQDRTVAFGGRILPNSTNQSPAKYLNSPETMIFTKSKMLYGLDVARNSIRKTKRVLIMEGYTDCIMTHQYGIGEAVAVLGTALGTEHIKILKRFADKMILVLDGDEAGKKRAQEVLGLFVAQGVNLSILTLPEEDDPCEYLLDYGKEAFENLIENESLDALEHAFRLMTENIDLQNDIVESSKALNNLLAIIALFPEKTDNLNDPVRLRVEKMIQRLAIRFRINEKEIRNQLMLQRNQIQKSTSRFRQDEQIGHSEKDHNPEANNDRQNWVYPLAENEEESNEFLKKQFDAFSQTIWQNSDLLPTQLEHDFLEIWFSSPDLFEQLIEKIDWMLFRSPVTKQLYLLGCDMFNKEIMPSLENVILRYENAEMKKFLVDLDDSANLKKLTERLNDSKMRNRLLEELYWGFERQKIELEEPKLINVLRETELDDQTKLKQLLELQHLFQKKQKNRFGVSGFKDESGPNN